MTNLSRKEQKAAEGKRRFREYSKNKKNGIFVEVCANEPTDVEFEDKFLYLEKHFFFGEIEAMSA